MRTAQLYRSKNCPCLEVLLGVLKLMKWGRIGALAFLWMKLRTCYVLGIYSATKPFMTLKVLVGGPCTLLCQDLRLVKYLGKGQGWMPVSASSFLGCKLRMILKIYNGDQRDNTTSRVFALHAASPIIPIIPYGSQDCQKLFLIPEL